MFSAAGYHSCVVRKTCVRITECSLFLVAGFIPSFLIECEVSALVERVGSVCLDEGACKSG
jgi:hypothetical protein